MIEQQHLAKASTTWERFKCQATYAVVPYLWLPITFTKRVVFGRDPYWRQYFFDKWGFVRTLNNNRRPHLLILAISGGEVTQAVSFFKKLRVALPSARVTVVVDSCDAHPYAKTLEGVDQVVHSPWDMLGPVRRFLNRLKPTAIVAIQNCFFPVLLAEASHRGLPILLVNGVMRPEAGDMNYRRTIIMGFYRHLKKIGVREECDREEFINLGVSPEAVKVIGNLKFDLDHIRLTPEERSTYLAELGWGADDPVFVVGSVHLGEEEVILAAYQRARAAAPRLRLLLAPRWQHEVPLIEEVLKAKGIIYQRMTALRDGGPKGVGVVVLDTFGELSRLYGLASVVFIGSSLIPITEQGIGHNIIEPLVHGIPVLFGPHMSLWRNITAELLGIWDGVEVRNAEELGDRVVTILNERAVSQALGERAAAIADANTGVVDRTVAFVTSAVNR
ncbi:MAG: glycosyltransferase N-terminal domain-containing protein [bacterium]|nr:glycosyltransferase N-terminal domain-containing protein [bacterium]